MAGKKYEIDMNLPARVPTASEKEPFCVSQLQHPDTGREYGCSL